MVKAMSKCSLMRLPFRLTGTGSLDVPTGHVGRIMLERAPSQDLRRAHRPRMSIKGESVYDV